MPKSHSAPEGRAVAVGAVIVRDDGAVLLVQRGRPPRAGSWSLPGGRREKNEALEAAVVREVREETGLAVRVLAPLGVERVSREGFRYEIHEFYCSVEGSRDASPGDDAADVVWAHDGDLARLGATAQVVKVIARARRARSLLPSPPCRVAPRV